MFMIAQFDIASGAEVVLQLCMDCTLANAIELFRFIANDNVYKMLSVP